MFYEDNTEIGKTTITGTGMYNYTSAIDRYFNIVRVPATWERLWGETAPDTMTEIMHGVPFVEGGAVPSCSRMARTRLRQTPSPRSRAAEREQRRESFASVSSETCVFGSRRGRPPSVPFPERPAAQVRHDAGTS